MAFSNCAATEFSSLRAAHGRISRLIAKLKQFAQIVARQFRCAAQNQIFFDDIFGDGRRGTIEPFAKLFLQQPEQQRKKFFGIIFGGEFSQIVQSHSESIFPRRIFRRKRGLFARLSARLRQMNAARNAMHRQCLQRREMPAVRPAERFFFQAFRDFP